MDCLLNKFWCVGCLIWLTSINFGYAQSPVWKEMKQLYPDESGVFLERDKVITLEAKGDSVTATAQVTERILFLKDRPDNATDMHVYGSHFQDIENIQAATSVWEKSKYKDIPLGGLTRQREDDASIFFDDSYFYRLSFPATHEGNQAYWSYTEKYRDARFISPYYFQDFLSQRKGLFVIRVPKGISIKWQVFNDPEKYIQFRQYEKSGFAHYEWKVENVPAIKNEEQSPRYSYFVPVVVAQVTEVKSNNKTVPVLSNLTDLHRWYFKTINPIDEEPTSQLIEMAKQIVDEGDAEIEKVRKVFYWVQDNVRYVAFEDGMRGLVPHKPSYVLEKRYGDCKDMASLIIGLLKSLGIKSYYTWIGTRDIAYQYSTVPSPAVDNHMIATYIDEGNNYFFLDGTSNHTQLTFPSSMIQGKEAFIALGTDKFEVKKVPEMPAMVNQKIDTVTLSIQHNTLLGKGKAYLTGYQKVFASYAFNKTVESRQKENVESWLKKGSNKFILNNYAIHNLTAKDNPLILDYDFSINDYITYVGSEIYINLNLYKLYYNQLVKLDRKVPVENDYRFSVQETYELKIPEGYEIEYLPPNASIQSDVINFSVTYRKMDSAVLMNFNLENNVLLMPSSQFEEWNKVVKVLSQSYKESIIFKKKTS
ncbi:MAG TPA: hypothetical protein DHV26_01760 [Cytophagales bacterium]|nr:hypothetical protein [Cytophagales bacterium]